MTDPLSTATTAAAAGAATQAPLAGLAAMLLAATGLEPRPVFWGLVGATIGLSMATKSPPLRAALVFACVSLGCALLGTWGARTLGWQPAAAAAGDGLARDGLVFALALLFHPLLNAVLAALPAALAAVLKRFGLGGGPP